jgi:two-component system, OmpR family, sensor kinase
VLTAVPIRWRLAAAFAVAMAVLLVALGTFVYLRVNGALRSSVDQALRAQAHESSLHAREGAFLDADARESGTVAELLDPDGRIVRADPGSLPVLVDRETLAFARRGPVLQTITRGSSEGRNWRTLAVPVGGNVLVVARSLHATEETLHHVFRGLIVAGPVGLFLATLGGYLLAAAALRPVESMRRRAGAISARTPGSRLPVPRSRDEIGDLAATLNDMLGRLEAALEHERRFVADASHELRTPLALLKAELDLALRRPRTADELRAAVTSAAEETDRLVRLAEDLLLIAQADQRLPLRIETLDVGEVVRDAVSRFDERAADGGRHLKPAVPDGLEVGADRLRIEQAIGNLIDNALRHGKGDVTVAARRQNGHVAIHVTDEGRGFPTGFEDRAFERFSRGEDVRGHGGSGLGLAIVKAIADAHGGTAGVTGGAAGTDVWLVLPQRAGADGP